MQFGLLGPLEVVDGTGSPVDVGGRQPRTVIALLLLAGEHAVPSGTLVDALWNGAPPPSATGTLQSYVSRLRQRLGAEAELSYGEAGYRLHVASDQVDVHRFTRLADEGARMLAAGRSPEAHERLVAAEALWRGPALVDLADVEAAAGAAARLEERRLAATEDRMAAALALGHHAVVAAELAQLVTLHPLREGLQAHLALALYRSGRQAEALRVLAAAGRTLRDELGIEPGRPLRDLEAAILAQDPTLELPRSSRPTAASRTAPGDHGAWTPPPLEGRDAELAGLLAALDEAAHDARVVVVEGEPGIGKTRLVDELRDAALARGSLAVWGRADERGAAPALWPWLPPLRAVAEALGDAPDEVAQLLAGTVETAAGHATPTRFERFEAVAELLERAGEEAPLVVLLDDLQWTDPTSLELLAHVAGRVRRGVLVVATMREQEIGRNDALTATLAEIARRRGSRRLALRGLPLDATASMLDAVGSRPLPGEVARAIHERAEGNPFYAIELSRLAHEEGLGDDVPGTVSDVVRRRIARLPAGTVELLGLAAVLGRDVELPLLAASGATTVAEVAERLDAAVVHRLLVEVPDRPGVLRFSHALVREVLLGSLTPLRRARLHLVVADAMEAAGAGPDEAEILAEHLWRAAPVGVGRRAAEALEQAAEVALRRVSFVAADELLTKAVQLRRATGTSREDQQAELRTHLRLLEAARAVRYFQGADQRMLQRALDLAERLGERDLAIQLRWFHWSARATAARVREATPLAEEFVALTEHDPRAEVRSLGDEVHGVSCWSRGRIAEAVEHFDRSLALLRGAPPPQDAFAAEHRLVAATFSILNHALHGDRSFEESGHAFDELAAATTDPFTVASVCGFAATTACAGGAWSDVDRFSTAALAADPAAQFAFWSGQTRMQRAIVLAWQGGHDEAIDRFAGGREQYTGIDGRSALPTFLACMAMHLAPTRAADAARMAAEARAVLEAWEERWNEPVVAMAEAVVAHHAGDDATAGRAITAAVEVATRQGAHALARRARRVAEELAITPG